MERKNIFQIILSDTFNPIPLEWWRTMKTGLLSCTIVYAESFKDYEEGPTMGRGILYIGLLFYLLRDTRNNGHLI